jgi:hypothetical protein
LLAPLSTVRHFHQVPRPRAPCTSPPPLELCRRPSRPAPALPSCRPSHRRARPRRSRTGAPVLDAPAPAPPARRRRAPGAQSPAVAPRPRAPGLDAPAPAPPSPTLPLPPPPVRTAASSLGVSAALQGQSPPALELGRRRPGSTARQVFDEMLHRQRVALWLIISSFS